MTIEWGHVKQPVDIAQAKSYVGRRIKWKTPRYRIACDGFSTEREGIAIWALPKGVKPTVCDEIAQAKVSQCYSMGSSKTGPSQNDRLIIRVERAHARTGEPLQPLYFAPRLSSIIAREI